MDFIGAKCDRWLESEGAAWQEVDRARPPGLIWKSRLADREDIVWPMEVTRFVGQPNTGIGDRHHTLAINDGKEHGPQPIRCGIDGFLIAKFAEVIGLAWLEQDNIGIAGTVQGDIMMIGDMAEKLPLGPGQSELNGRAPADTESCIEQLIESHLSS